MESAPTDNILVDYDHIVKIKTCIQKSLTKDTLQS